MRWAFVWLVAACSFEPGKARIDANGDTAGQDGDIDASIGTGPWGAPTLVSSLAGGPKDDPTLTADLLEMYFNTCSATCDLYVTTRSSLAGTWATPALVTDLNTTALESTPRVSPDGLIIYFGSVRGAVGSDDIYVATRADRASAWRMPQLVTELSTAYSDYGPSPDPSQLRIVFNSDTTPSQYLDIWEATRATTDATWGNLTNLASINSAGTDLSACLSSDDLTIYFHSSRTGNDELYQATRDAVGSAFGAPQPIVELNTIYQDDDAWVSPDGHTMFFASDRDSPGTLQIYETHR